MENSGKFTGSVFFVVVVVIVVVVIVVVNLLIFFFVNSLNLHLKSPISIK